MILAVALARGIRPFSASDLLLSGGFERREWSLLIAVGHDVVGGEEVSTIGSKQEASHKKVKDST